MQRFVFCLISLIALTVNAQNINVRGVVSDTRNGKVISNATVTLLQPLLKDTSLATGIYVITKGNVAVIPVIKAQNGKISLNRGILKLSLTAQSPVKVEVFDVKGKLLKKEVLQTAIAGIHQFDITESYRATNLLVLKVSIGDQMMTFRCLPAHNNSFAVNASFDNAMSLTGSSGLNKTLATKDTLHIRANGYLTKYVPIESYDTTVNVTLDSILPGPSRGCGKTLGSIRDTGTYTIRSSSTNRTFIVNIPKNYDKNKPYRLIFGMHCMGGSAMKVAGTDDGKDQSADFYHIKNQADKDNIECIYVAPLGNDNGTWQGKPDRQFFFDLQKMLKDTLCIDTMRVFSVGFSFGAMFTYALSLEYPKLLRAVACNAPANYSMEQPTNLHIPIAYVQTTGTVDGMCPWIRPPNSTTEGGKYCLLQHLKDNGCIIPDTIRLATTGKHVTTDFQGGKEPVKFCSHNGDHLCNRTDTGSNVDWIPVEFWEFFKRF